MFDFIRDVLLVRPPDGAAHQVSADGVALARVFAVLPVALLRYGCEGT
ncbi:MAG TPA: hypothetical protein VIM74_02330 [Casimicrobiaceae bacterium]